MWENIIISFIVGIFSNLATHFVIQFSKKNRPPSRAILKNWLRVLKWNMIPLAFFSLTLYMVNYRWVLTSGWNIIFLLLSVVISMGIIVIIIHHPSIQWLKFVCFGFTMLLFFVFDEIIPHYISLNCPDVTANKSALEGKVLDPNSRVFLLIRPSSFKSPYIEVPSIPDQDGMWYATIDFPGVIGEKYEIIAIAVPRDSSFPNGPGINPEPEWIIQHALYKTKLYLVTKQE